MPSIFGAQKIPLEFLSAYESQWRFNDVLYTNRFQLAPKIPEGGNY
jgi:hypothetical protein